MCQSLTRSRLHLSSLGETKIPTIQVTHFEFQESEWTTRNVNLSISNCDMSLMSLSVFSDNTKDIIMHIVNTRIGSQLQIAGAEAVLDNCTYIQRENYRKELIKMHNGKVTLKSSNIFNVNNYTVLNVHSGEGILVGLFVTNCSTLSSHLLSSLFIVHSEAFLNVQNCTFLSNEGTLIAAENSSLVLIENSVFELNGDAHQSENNGFYVVQCSWRCFLFVTNSLFLNNTKMTGGVLSITNASSAYVFQSVFNNNQGKQGTVSVNSSTNVIISMCSFNGNTAEQGGAVYCTSNMKFLHQNDTMNELRRIASLYHMETHSAVSRFLNISKHIHRQVDNAIEIDNCVFTSNSAFGGGAIYSASINTTLILLICQFTNNSATKPSLLYSSGGAVYFGYCLLLIVSSNFAGNRALEGGGAIVGHGVASVESSNFTQNQVIGKQGLGGAIYVTRLAVNNSVFERNTASLGGGAICGETLHIQGSLFQFNSAYVGGVISVPSGNISNCLFIHNTALDTGGALSVTSVFFISDTNFKNNRAKKGGGAIFGSGNVSLICRFCQFHNNTVR